MLGHEVDVVTPNGFEDDFVWQDDDYRIKREEARAALIAVAEACLGRKLQDNPLIVGTSGRYEFRNKGLDVLLEGMKRLAGLERLDREVVLYVMVPAANRGARADLQKHLQDPSQPIDGSQWPWATHYLENMQWDPIVRAIDGSPLADPASKVHVIFVPSYLDDRDGIFDKSYYELLVGMDLTLFPSYYEPWGYTPLESIAFSVPTVTTTLAGFGLWIDRREEHPGVAVLCREDGNDDEVASALADAVLRFSQLDAARVEEMRRAAGVLSKEALWSRLFEAYEEAYALALDNADVRMNHVASNATPLPEQQVKLVHQALRPERPEWNRMMVEKNLPERLRPLEELAHNLWWCWNHRRLGSVRGDRSRPLEPKSERNPIAFLDLLTINRLKELERDESFLASLDGGICAVQELHVRKTRSGDTEDRLFLDGIRLACFAEDLFGRFGHPGRRLSEGGVRQERADGRGRIAVPVRLFYSKSSPLRGLSRRLTKHRTSRSCRSSPCAMRWATGRPCRFPCRDVRSRPASGFAGWDVPTCTCSTPITRPISRRIAG